MKSDCTNSLPSKHLSRKRTEAQIKELHSREKEIFLSGKTPMSFSSWWSKKRSRCKSHLRVRSLGSQAKWAKNGSPEWMEQLCCYGRGYSRENTASKTKTVALGDIPGASSQIIPHVVMGFLQGNCPLSMEVGEYLAVEQIWVFTNRIFKLCICLAESYYGADSAPVISTSRTRCFMLLRHSDPYGRPQQMVQFPMHADVDLGLPPDRERSKISPEKKASSPLRSFHDVKVAVAWEPSAWPGALNVMW